MRTFQQLCAAFVLTLMLALSAFAGEIQTTIASQSPPSTTQAATTQGEISTTSAGQIDTPFQAALNLLQGVFSLI